MIATFLVLFMIICIIGGFYGLPILFAFPVIILVVIVIAAATGKLHYHDDSEDEENLIFTEFTDKDSK